MTPSSMADDTCPSPETVRRILLWRFFDRRPAVKRHSCTPRGRYPGDEPTPQVIAPEVGTHPGLAVRNCFRDRSALWQFPENDARRVVEN
jgi:hypothetical protein